MAILNKRIKRTGKKNAKVIIEKEIAKIETQRPNKIRKKINGEWVVIQNEIIEQAEQDKESLSLLKSKKTRNKQLKIQPSINGKVITDYFFTPCVYILYQNKNIVYIGQTNDLARRISEHKESKIFDNFRVHEHIKDEYIRLQVEKALIKIHKPIYNIVHK